MMFFGAILLSSMVFNLVQASPDGHMIGWGQLRILDNHQSVLHLTMLVLVIGDFHIPERSICIHPAFKALLSPGKIHHIWCTGNLTSCSVYDQLKFICTDVHVVKGDFDQLTFPETEVLTVGNLKIGLTHGHQIVPWGNRESLSMLRRQLNVDILISGHTHVAEAYRHDGCIYLNPGSATGAFTPLESDPQPTFMLLDIQESVINLYTYRLNGSEHKVERTEFLREA